MTALTARAAGDAATCCCICVGVAGLAFALTGVWLGMRSVMDIGGACGSGGPYEIATPCPAGIEVLLALGFPIGFVSAGLMVWRVLRIRATATLAWWRSPGPRCSCAWAGTSWSTGSATHSAKGWSWAGSSRVSSSSSWAACRCGWCRGPRPWPAVPGVRETTTPIELSQLATAMRRVSARASRQAAATTTVAEAMSAPGPAPDGAQLAAPAARRAALPARGGAGGATGGAATEGGLVDQLERLARLHDTGAIGELEYLEAKQAVIGAASRGQTA